MKIKLPIVIASYFILSNTGFTQIQKGIDLDGIGTYDSFGRSLSMSADGNTIAIGAPEDQGIGDNGGYVNIYNWDGVSWVQKGLTIPGQAVNDFFGNSVSLSADGNTVAVGAPVHNGSGPTSGSVQVFDWTGSTWVQRGISINGEAAFDDFGQSVSLSADGNTFIAGAHNNSTTLSNAGMAMVYEWTGTAWAMKGAKIYGEAIDDHSGLSVALNSSGTIMSIGARENDGNGTDAGHVRVFEWSGSAWVQKGADLDGEAAGDYFGSSVSLNASGNTLIVGGPYNNGNGSNSGHARIFSWSGTAWIQKGGDIDGEHSSSFSGSSVAISNGGDTVAIGAPQNSDGGGNSGSARVYKWIGSNWSQVGVDIDGEAASDFSGGSVDLNANGRIMCIGATLNDGTAAEAGNVRIYDFSTATGIYDDIFAGSIAVYPNPIQDKATIELDKIYENVTVKIMNVLGEEMYFNRYANTNKMQVNLSGATGIYFAVIQTNENIFESVKLVKK
jgi:hypothetical protein